MYINKSKILEKYKNSEQSFNKEKTAKEVVAAILNELERSMIIVADSIERTTEWRPKEQDLKIKNKHFTKALTAIYSLQTSLNFDEGEKIAVQLFQLYEYCRKQLIKGFTKKVVNGIRMAAAAIKDILSAWQNGIRNAN
mgnify:FL=1|tara:strand:+ start:378 stop:794 length:417 start_codon:yes stop_codon:yes gene_type:complete